MTDLKNGELLDILPEPLKQDADVQAISYALKHMILKLAEYSKATLLCAEISSMPENILDYMAVEYELPVYDESYDIDTKRKLIANALLVYMAAGTKEATENIIDIVFGKSKIKEWTELEGGEPGTFEVSIDTRVTDKLYEQAESAIRKVKNASSHLTRLITKREASLKETCKVAESEHVIQTLPNDIKADAGDQRAFLENFIGIVESAIAVESAHMDVPNYSIDVSIAHKIFAGLGEHMHEQIFELIDPEKLRAEKTASMALTEHSITWIGGEG